VLPDQLRKEKVLLGALASLVPSLVQSCSHRRYDEHLWDKHEQNTTFLERILVGSWKGAGYGIVGLFVHKHFFHTVSALQRYQAPVPDTTSPACHALPYPRRCRALPPACTSPSVAPKRRDYYHHQKPRGRPLPRTFPRPSQLWARAAYRGPKLSKYSEPLVMLCTSSARNVSMVCRPPTDVYTTTPRLLLPATESNKVMWRSATHFTRCVYTWSSTETVRSP